MTSNKVKVWRMADGSVRLTVFVLDAMLKSETEDQTIERLSDVNRSMPEYVGATEFIKTRQDIRTALGNEEKAFHKLRCSSSGSLSKDDTALSPVEKYDSDMETLGSKLGLTQADINLLKGR